MKVALFAGLVLGGAAAWKLKIAHRAWQDWRRAVAGVPVLRRVFYRHTGGSLLWVAILAVVAVVLLR